MTMMSGPWLHPDPQESKLRLVEVPGTVLHALAQGKDVRVPGHAVFDGSAMCQSLAHEE